LVVVPLFAALFTALYRRPFFGWFMTVLAGVLCSLISAVLAKQVFEKTIVSYHIGGWDPSIGIEYRVDPLNAPILVLISLISLAISPFARRSVAAEIPADRANWFYTVYLVALSGLLGIGVTGDAFNAFVFLEISSLASYALIAMGRDRRALLAAYQYLIVGTIGATFYVFGVGLLYSMTGTLNFALLAERLGNIGLSTPVLAAVAFILVGLGIKAALFPLHAWLPNAYAYAPSFATIFLAATSTKIALYLFARFVFLVFDPRVLFDHLRLAPLLVALSVAAMFGASLAAVFQSNLKRSFAFSSVGQIGYITLGYAMASVTGLTGGLLHLFNHALVKGALFMALGTVSLRVNRMEIKDLAGIGRVMPATMAAFVVAGLGLIGVPGTAGFISKWYLILAAIEKGWWWLAFLIAASSLIALAYVGRVVEAAWFREPSAILANVREAPAELLVPLWIMAAAVVLFGLDTSATVGAAERAAQWILGRP
jgi:multicomponent Na+:H+ antiporter subunit D